MALSIFIRHQQSGLVSPRAALNAYTRAVLQCAAPGAGFPDGEISVVYTSPRVIQKLNHDWRSIDRATDVLSFPAAKTPRRGGHLGDLAICLAVCAKEVPEFGKSLDEVVALMLVHGLLHLLGFDHKDAKTERAMESETARLMAHCATIARPRIRVRKSSR